MIPSISSILAFIPHPPKFSPITNTTSFIPFLRGYESNLAIKIGEVYKEGRDHDLSAFGTDIFNWQELSLQVEDKTGVVLLNGKKIYEVTFKEGFGDIKRLDFRTSGLVEIDHIRFKNLDGMIIYEDSFSELEQ